MMYKEKVGNTNFSSTKWGWELKKLCSLPTVTQAAKSLKNDPEPVQYLRHKDHPRSQFLYYPSVFYILNFFPAPLTFLPVPKQQETAHF